MKAKDEIVLRLVFSKNQIWALLTASLLLASALGIQGDSLTLTTYYPAPYGNYTSLTTKNLKVTGGSPGVGKVLTSDAQGTATWMDSSASEGISFGGLFSTYDSPAGSCKSANPVTGACSCPANFTDSSFYVETPEGSYGGWCAGYEGHCDGARNAYIHQCWKP